MTKNNKVANTSTENKQKLNEKDLQQVSGGVLPYGHEFTWYCPRCKQYSFNTVLCYCDKCGYRADI